MLYRGSQYAGIAELTVPTAYPYRLSYPRWWCPAAIAKANATCGAQVHTFATDEFPAPLALSQNGEEIEVYGSDNVAFRNYTPSVVTAFQVMLAAVRLDLGNVLPNNIIAHPITAPSSAGITNGPSPIWSDFIAPSSDPDLPSVVLNGTRASGFAVQYQCHVQQRKSAGAIFVSVVVATVTLFNSGWGVALLLLAYMAKRKTPHGEFPSADTAVVSLILLLVLCHSRVL